ncbi:hypothetical protein ACWFMI_25265 [Nocardiopsis terrae]
MAEQPEAKCADTRPVPPLGYCAECIREGEWVRAATLWEGTALCAQDLVHHVGPGDGVRDSVENSDEERDVKLVLLDGLRRGLSPKGRTPGF